MRWGIEKIARAGGFSAEDNPGGKERKRSKPALRNEDGDTVSISEEARKRYSEAGEGLDPDAQGNG